MMRSAILSLLFLLLTGCASAPSPKLADPLPSWNPLAAESAITEFVARVTDPRGPDFLPPSQRVAVFDNDGCLWAEKPTYFQLLFVLDRIRELAPQHPEWNTTQPFKAVLENDQNSLAAAGEHGLLVLAAAAQTGMTTDEFTAAVRQWMTTARHPVTGRPYTSMVYQPMLELMDYLRANGFSVYIVSGGGQDFIRAWAENAYGVAPENVVGSTFELRYEERADQPVIVREPALDFIDDKAGKPVGIQRFIGQRPVFAAGNSDGDYEMLRWTTSGSGPRFGLLVHHTDAKREWAYDRNSAEGRLDRALDDAAAYGWLVVDMARDWSTVFPPPAAQ